MSTELPEHTGTTTADEPRAPSPVPASSSRAARVLEQLAREADEPAPRRSWRLRQLPTVPRSLLPSAEAHRPAADEPAHDAVVRPLRVPSRARGAPWALSLVVLVAVVVVLTVARRPPPIEEQLPMASGTTPASSTEADERDPAAEGDGGASSDDGGSSRSDTSTTAPGPDERATASPLVVHVAGAVSAPGVVRLSPGARVVDAVTAAGGLRADADPDRVNLAAPLIDGQRVVVPVLGQPAPAELVPQPSGTAGGAGAAGSGAAAPGGTGAPAGPIDLNTATAEQLDTLPGVGPSTAAAILAHRDEQGPFASVDDLLDVRGIGEAKLEALRDLVTVGA